MLKILGNFLLRQPSPIKLSSQKTILFRSPISNTLLKIVPLHQYFPSQSSSMLARILLISFLSMYVPQWEWTIFLHKLFSSVIYLQSHFPCRAMFMLTTDLIPRPSIIDRFFDILPLHKMILSLLFTIIPKESTLYCFQSFRHLNGDSNCW